MSDASLPSPRKPRVVPPPDADSDSLADRESDYEFFVFGPSKRAEAIKEKIEERERSLLDLELIEAMLDGNPNPGTHLTEAQRTRTLPDGQVITPPCQCGTCELPRVKSAIAGLQFALRKLRALHSRLVC